jgi:hypothetical protein
LKRKEFLVLLLLTFGALLVAGYHPFAEDAEIYLPGVEKLLHPELFPFNAQFFADHAGHTLFPNLIAWSVRLTHLPLVAALFFLQLASIFLLLLACWELSSKCFSDETARWAGVSLIAALLTLPVAGTALYILDQYVNPRNLAAFAMIFAIVKILDKKIVQAALFLILAALIHPFMAAFAIFFCALLVVMQNVKRGTVGIAALAPFGLTLDPPTTAYHQVALHHPEHYLIRWQWYEWLGAIAPIFILAWMARLARSRGQRNFELLCRTLIVYLLVFLPVALILSIPARLEALARLQPMRCLYLLYILMFLFAGCLLGEYVLKNRIWRWLVLFVPLCLGMFMAQRSLFPYSAHVEWPGAAPKNPWVQAFVWTRTNTPTDAIFALGPDSANLPTEDEQGFRAIAERSRLADTKDAGAASMFPPLADEWLRQSQAQSGWKNFRLEDFRRLHNQYGVTWVIVEQPRGQGLDCPYQNDVVKVCRVN